MKIEAFTLKAETLPLLKTEILYLIASSRASDMEIIRFDVEADSSDRIISYAIKILKSLKKQGKVGVFISAQDIIGESKEAEYLKNKYPELLAYAENEKSVIVKLN